MAPPDATTEGSVVEPEQAPSTRGRPREFDEEEVLDHLVEIFWAQGYEATSITDLVEGTGLNKSSLYNCFGSKEGLYAAAIERYVDVRSSMLIDIANNGTEGLDDIGRLLDLQETELASERGHMGCLMVNTSTELGLRDEAFAGAARQFRAQFREALATVFDRAESTGQIQAGAAPTYIEILLAFTMSLGVITRGGATPDELSAQFSAIRALVESWRV